VRKYVLRRLASSVPTLFGITVVIREIGPSGGQQSGLC
jgi:hypothetical protein